MAYEVKFDTGQTVSFANRPTDSDIEEVVKQLGIKPKSASIPPSSKPAPKSVGQKILDAGTSVSKFFGGEGISELAGAGIASLRAKPEERKFVDYPSAKKVAGSALQLGTTLAGPAIFGAASKAIGPGVGIIRGAIQGAKIGAAGSGAIGALSATGQAAQQDKSTLEILQSGLIGGLGGAAVGGVLGAATGAVTGRIASNKITRENFADELTSPKITPNVEKAAIKSGRFTDPTYLEKAKILATEHENVVADSVRNIVKPEATLGQNIDAIRMERARIDLGVKNYISNNKIPFNTKQLTNQLMQGKDDLRLVFASDASAEKTYDAAVKVFLRSIKNRDTLGLMEARQKFDQIPAIKKLLDSQAIGENAKQQIVLAVRRAANNYVSNLLPNGNIYKPLMKQSSLMEEALINIADKSQGLIGKTSLQLLAEKYPILNYFIARPIGGTGVGAGSAAIGSI